MAIRTCVQLNVFNILVEKETTSAREIAERSGADEALLRMLYFLFYMADRMKRPGTNCAKRPSPPCPHILWLRCRKGGRALRS